MEKLTAIYPGAFKPFHDGHFLQVLKYLDCTDYDVNVKIIISTADREGITAATTEKFIKKVFAGYEDVDIEISKYPSPIRTTYEMIAETPGLYTMVSSSKGGDDERIKGLKKYYGEGGKGFNPEITVIDPPVDISPILYDNRLDGNNSKEISSTIVRSDIRNDNFLIFKTSYKYILENSAVTENDLEEYFENLKKELIPYKDKMLNDSQIVESICTDISHFMLNEGGAAGHMAHPYEVDEFTFRDLKDLNSDIFSAKISHITEKLDGQNLFASVDKRGKTIYARNVSDMKNGGLTVEGMREKWKDNPIVAESFIYGAQVIDNVFKQIRNKVRMFNNPAVGEPGSTYQWWINCEIINSTTVNVIPYKNNCVYFHGAKLYQYTPKFFQYVDVDTSEIMDEIKTASESVQNASVTNEIIVKQLNDNSAVIEKFNDRLNNIMDMYELHDEDSLYTWKCKALKRYIRRDSYNNHGMLYDFMYKGLPAVKKEVTPLLEKRWITGSTETSLKDIKALAVDALKSEYKDIAKDEIKEILHNTIDIYDKEKIAPILKRCLRPLDRFFMDFGNEVIDRCSGFNNDNAKAAALRDLTNKLRTTVLAIRDDEDPVLRAKLRDQLIRLKNTGNKINATEGIVLKYKNKTIKLTGSFAAVNQILGMKRYKR